MGTFDVVITSPLPRAAETAIAMGYGIDQEVQDLAVVGKGAMAEIDWPMSFSQFTERTRPGTALAQRGSELSALLLRIANEIGEGRSVLLLSHGAVIEMAAIASTPWLDHTTWGPHCGHCEGVRLTVQEDIFVAAEILRVEDASGR